MSPYFARSRLGLVVAAMVLGGCATQSPYRPQPKSAHADASVTVTNDQWEDLTVYLERDGGRLRLGVVPGKLSRILNIPDPFVTPNSVVRLVAQSIGRETHGVSSYFELDPGCRAFWSVGLTGTTTPVIMGRPES